MHAKALTCAMCASLGFAATANAAAPPAPTLSLLPMKSGDTANFAFSFDGKFGMGQDEIVDDRFTIHMDPADGVTMKTATLKPLSQTGKRGSDGLITVTDGATPSGDLVVDYNTIVLLTKNATPALAPGDNWTSHLIVRTSPDTTLDTPVRVTVKSVDVSQITLDATGSSQGTLFFKGFTFPIDVAVHTSATFGHDGRFRLADFSAKETTQMGYGPTIAYSWRVAAQP